MSASIHVTAAVAGGSGTYVADLVTALRDQGHHVDLICPQDFERASSLRASDPTRVLLAPRSHVGDIGRVRKGLRAIASTIGTIAILAGHRRGTRVAHFDFMGLPILSIPVLLSARLLGLAVVLTVHDVVPHRQRLPPLMRPLVEAIRRVEYALADRLIVHYRAAADSLHWRYGVPVDRIVVIPHAAPTVAPPRRPDASLAQTAPAAPVPREIALHEEAAELKLRVLVLGVIRSNKGIDKAIAAVQLLRAAGESIELTIAGAPHAVDAGYWRVCVDMIRSAPAGITTIARRLSDVEIDELIAAADAVVLPYDSFDAQSGVAVRAIARGRPIIATASGGLGELLAAAPLGLRIEEPSVSATADALRRATTLGRARLRTLGEAGRAHAERSLSADRIAGDHIRLYASLEGGR